MQPGAGSGDQQHLQPPPIIGAPAGFRDSSFDDADDSLRRSPGVGVNADGRSPELASSSFADVKKRPAPPAPPPPGVYLPTPPLIVRDFNYRNKRPAPEAPRQQPAAESADQTLPDVLPPNTATTVGGRDRPVAPAQAADIGRVVIPEVFRQSKTETANARASSRSANSIFRRSSFLRHLETVVGRNTPPTTSSAVSTITRRADDAAARDVTSSHHAARHGGGDLDQSTESLVSRLFHTALRNHDDHDAAAAAEKKFKFPVAGIDVAAAESAAPQETTTQQRTRVRKGFSYLKDVDEAAEVTRRAADVTARRPHQSVEEARTMRDRLDDGDVDRDEATLRAARARLHAPQPQLDLPATTSSSPQSAAVGGQRQHLLQDIVDAARRRSRKNGETTDDDDDVEEHRATTNYRYYRRAEEHVRDAYDGYAQQSARQFATSSSTLQQSAGDVRDASRVNSVGGRAPEVLGSVSAAAAAMAAARDNDRGAGGHGMKATDYYHVPPAAAAAWDDGRDDVMGVAASHRAARHAQRGDIEREAAQRQQRSALDSGGGGVLNPSSYLSAAPAVGSRYATAAADDQSTRGVPLARDGGPRQRPRRRKRSASSSDAELDFYRIDDDDDDEFGGGGDGGYTVSIAGGRVHARRRRPRSPSRRRPHVRRRRPVSVEVLSSGDEPGPSRPTRRPRSPLTVDTDTARRPRSVVGHIRNAGITTELVDYRPATGGGGGVAPESGVCYFSDPETQLGPYRTGAYVSSQPDLYRYSHSALGLGAPELDTIATGTRAFYTLPAIHADSLPIARTRMEAAAVVSSVDPKLADVGTKNRRYFVEMKLNAAREVAGAGGSSSSGGGGVSNVGLGLAAARYGSAPQLLQLGRRDDVTDQYLAGALAGAPPEYADELSAAMQRRRQQQSARYTSVYDVTADHGGTSLVVRRPATPPPPRGPGRAAATPPGGASTPVGHVRRSPAAFDRRRRPANGDVNRSTVEFDIELEPVMRQRRGDQLDEEGRRSTLLSTVHANRLTAAATGNSPTTV